MIVLARTSFAKALPLWVLGWYVVINLVTFWQYLQDKNAAQTGSWRVQESVLHNLSLFGGWFGASVAHKSLRHKSQKTKFRQLLYLTIIGNLILLGMLWYFKLR